MYEFNLTFEDIEKMTPEQMHFLQAGLELKYEEEKKAMEKAKRAQRRPRRR